LPDSVRTAVSRQVVCGAARFPRRYGS
jgi:hypothetical protein